MTKTLQTTFSAKRDINVEKSELIEGVDFTIDADTGFMVFTEAYLLKRGYCCETGCRNCPYGFGKGENDE